MSSIIRQIQKILENDKAVFDFHFTESEIHDKAVLSEMENIPREISHRALEYLIKLNFSKSDDEKFSVFETPLIKAAYVSSLDTVKKLYSEAMLGGNSVICAAVKLACLEAALSDGNSAFLPPEDFCPDEVTMLNINNMTKRCTDFFSGSRKVIKFDFDFEGAYNGTVSNGTGDYLTKDGIWSVITLDTPPTEEHCVLLAACYVLGLRSYNSAKFRKVKELGIFNPRLGKAYSVNISDISKSYFTSLTKELIR